MVKNLSKLLLSLSMVIFLLSAGYGQTGTVTGTVRDANDGSTLPGASILVKGTTTGVTTDMNGNFSIEVEPGTVLIVSYLGYREQEIPVEPGETLNVRLVPTTTALDELVVIGYGVTKKEDATGSVSAIDSDEFNTGAITSPEQLISGRVSGVQITDGGGAPGTGSTIRIRGGSSLTATNDPLFVIDGVPVDNDDVSGMRNPLNVLNPNDIESVTVLKDASATAIYGSRASNGVIIITTKKAKEGVLGEGVPLSLTYNGKFTLSEVNKTVDVFDADEFRELINERHPNQAEMMGEANTNWQEEIFRNSFGMDHYLSASGAVKSLPYRFSLGYADKDGILKTDNMQRTTLSAALNPSLFDDHLKINLNARGMLIDNHFADNGAIAGAVQFDPTQPVYADNDYNGYFAWLQPNGNPVGQATTNPVALLELREDNSNVNRFIGNAEFDYKFKFLPQLRANLNLGYDYSKGEGTVYVPLDAAWEYNPEFDSAANMLKGGVDNTYEQEKRNELLDFYLNYTRDMDFLNSRVELMGGYSWQHFYRSNYEVRSNIARTEELTEIIDDREEYYLISYFGRLNYSILDRYLLTLTIRNDNTSRFAPDNRQGWFPSVALAWKINNEAFLQNADWLSQLKLRGSWGITGQQDISNNYYPYLARYTLSQFNASYQLGNQFYYTLRPEGYNEEIKWEETTTYNIGLDFGFAKDRYYGSIDYYYRETKDLLNEIPYPAGTNLTNFILTNIGNLENRGVEFSIFTRPVVTEDINWEIGLNASYNENEITKLIATDDPNYLGVETGGISGGVGNNIQIHSVGFPSSSFFVYEQVYDPEGKPIQGVYVDRNGDGQITNDDRYHYEDPAADVSFGISSNLRYENWTFAFAGRANFGNYVYNNVASENANYERLYRPEGPYLSNITTAVLNTGFVNPQYLSDHYIQDGSFFRMDYIRLAYLFDNLINGKANLTLSLTVNNAFLITDYDGLDPEIFGGIDNNIYPRPRTYVFGVNFQF